MAENTVVIDDRVFYISISSMTGQSTYKCMFHEKYMLFGRAVAFSSNKNFATKEAGEIYDWFHKMVENNTPHEKSDEVLLEEVIEQLTEEFDQVDRQ